MTAAFQRLLDLPSAVLVLADRLWSFGVSAALSVVGSSDMADSQRMVPSVGLCSLRFLTGRQLA